MVRDSSYVRKNNFSFLVVLEQTVHVFYFAHLEPAGLCMFFISHAVNQEAVHIFFFARLGPDGPCMFFFRAPWALGAEHVFFSHFGPCAKN